MQLVFFSIVESSDLLPGQFEYFHADFANSESSIYIVQHCWQVCGVSHCFKCCCHSVKVLLASV